MTAGRRLGVDMPKRGIQFVARRQGSSAVEQGTHKPLVGSSILPSGTPTYPSESQDMTERYLEDLHVGDRFESGTFAVTEKGIVDFAHDFDPQPFHLDLDAAKRSVFQGLAASGWHTAAMSMKLFVTGGLRLAGGSVGLSVDELQWPRPVRPGDTLRLDTEIVEVRPSRSKPDRGIIRIRNVTTNQNGEVVQTFLASVLVRRRPTAN
jgi:acyl dehydratase